MQFSGSLNIFWHCPSLRFEMKTDLFQLCGHCWVFQICWHTGAISNSPPLFPSILLDTFQPRGLIFWCHIFFDFLYCPWGSSKKNTGVGCHLLLHWTMFCQNSSGTAKALLERLWPVCLECPCMAWLMAHSFIELCKPLHHDKVVFHEREDNA